jgi:hypothetical protein
MAIKHYKKEIPEAPVFVMGHPMRFDLLETQDPTLIAELDKCVTRGIGGVMSIAPEEYSEEIKKKELWSQSNNSLKPQQRQELSALRLDARRVVEAVGNPAPRVGMFAKPQVPTEDRNRSNGNGQPMPEPIEVPTPESFVVKQPPTMKMSEAKKAKTSKV